MAKIGIYCGSFNPVHNGHIAIAKACIEEGLVDKVRIIATGAYWNKDEFYPIKDRIAMLKLAAKKDIEIDETYNEFPYTYQIFQALTKENPEDEFSLILGGDNLPRFSDWKEYEYLLNFRFIILPRGDIDKEKIDELMKRLHKKNYDVLKHETIDISSTYIRTHICDYDLIKDMIDKNVYEYLLWMKERDDAARDHEQTPFTE